MQKKREGVRPEEKKVPRHARRRRHEDRVPVVERFQPQMPRLDGALELRPAALRNEEADAVKEIRRNLEEESKSGIIPTFISNLIPFVHNPQVVYTELFS